MDRAPFFECQGVVDGQVNFWVFLQLFRAMKRKQAELPSWNFRFRFLGF